MLSRGAATGNFLLVLSQPVPSNGSGEENPPEGLMSSHETTFHRAVVRAERQRSTEESSFEETKAARAMPNETPDMSLGSTAY